MKLIYPITDYELEEAEEALDRALAGCASLTSCVHAVIGAIEQARESA